MLVLDHTQFILKLFIHFNHFCIKLHHLLKLMVSYATVDIHLYYLMEVYLIEPTVVTSYLKYLPRN